MLPTIRNTINELIMIVDNNAGYTYDLLINCIVKLVTPIPTIRPVYINIKAISPSELIARKSIRSSFPETSNNTERPEIKK